MAQLLADGRYGPDLVSRPVTVLRPRILYVTHLDGRVCDRDDA